jgi:hypothetical protein
LAVELIQIVALDASEPDFVGGLLLCHRDSPLVLMLLFHFLPEYPAGALKAGESQMLSNPSWLGKVFTGTRGRSYYGTSRKHRGAASTGGCIGRCGVDVADARKLRVRLSWRTIAKRSVRGPGRIVGVTLTRKAAR